MLQQGTTQQNGNSHLPMLMFAVPCRANCLYHNLTHGLQYCTKIYIPGGPAHKIGHICIIGRHIKDTDLFRLVWAGH